MISNENEIEVYQWSKADDRWIKIGVAVGSSSAGGGAAGSRQKSSYLGKVILAFNFFFLFVKLH